MSTGAVSKANNQNNPPSELKKWLNGDKFKEEVAKALPRHLTPERFIRVATTATIRTPGLMRCTPESVLNCLLQLSQLGLEPDGRVAHLIPYKDQCTLIVDYKGIVEVVNRSGLVSNIHADVICENDEFLYDRGEIKRHVINFRKPRGEAYAAYALVRMKDGSEKAEVLSKEDIYAIRNRSQGWIAFEKKYARQSPWDPTNPQSEYEMWKKTAFRRVSKWLPWSPEIRDAIEADDDQFESSRANVITVSADQSKSDALANLLGASREPQGEPETTPEPIEQGGEP